VYFLVKVKQVWLALVVGWAHGGILLNSAVAAEINNSWTNVVGGFWEVPSNWTDGSPSLTHTWQRITNANSKVVHVYSPLPVSTLTVSNIWIGAPAGETNTLAIHDLSEGPLRVVNLMWVYPGGEVTVNQATQVVDSVQADAYQIDGQVTLESGMILVTNGIVAVGHATRGQMSVKDGELRCQTMRVGVLGSPTVLGGNGTFVAAGGQTLVLNRLEIGMDPGSTGAVRVAGGSLAVSNLLTVASAGTGSLTVSNGLIEAQETVVGASAGAVGTVLVSGGMLTATNGETFIGLQGQGALTVADGEVQTKRVHVGFHPGANGELELQGGTLSLSTFLDVGVQAGSTGTVSVAGGELIATNAAGTGAIVLTGGGLSTWIQNDGVVMTDALYVTNGVHSAYVFNGGLLRSQSTLVSNQTYFVVGDNGGTATLLLEGAVHTFVHGLLLAGSSGSGGSLEAHDTEVRVPSHPIHVGYAGNGLLIISNSTVKSGWLIAGMLEAAAGAIELMHGTLEVNGDLSLGDDFSAQGTLTMTQSELVVTNGTTHLGGRWDAGIGEISFANSLARLQNAQIADHAESQGTVTINQGAFTVDQAMIVGNHDCSSTANVELIAGNLLVTNAAANAVLDVRGGSLWQYGGLLQVDRLVVTNECGRARLLNGARAIGELVLAPDFDADGDGMPNGWETANDLDPLTPVGDQGADGDPDGDGQPNIVEFQAGTDPHNPDSVFRIMAIEREGDGVRLTWTCAGGHSYIVQSNAPAGAGSFSGSFDDLSEAIPVYGEGESVTNYLHVGGALLPACYYRVRLGPPAVPGILGGTVLNMADAPIPGATVAATGGYEITTGESGQYELVLPPGTYNVTASAPGYAPQTATGVLVIPDPVTRLDFVLSPSP